jgi:hypothetical protein
MITIDEIRSTAPMRALSWKQPYGSAMLYGKIETRTWPSHYRGLVLICTSKQPYNEYYVRKISGDVQFVRLCKLLEQDNGRTVDLDGFAIAVGRIDDSYPMPVEDEDRAYVMCRFGGGLYCHIYEDVTPIKPFPWKGSQGWRTVPSDIRNKIELLP